MRPLQIDIPLKNLKLYLIGLTEALEVELIARGTKQHITVVLHKVKLYVADYWECGIIKILQYHNHYPYAMSFAYYVNCQKEVPPSFKAMKFRSLG